MEPAPLVHAALLNAPELHHDNSIHVIAAGKAAAGMTAAALETLGNRVASCVVAAPANTLENTHAAFSAPYIRVFAAGHPLPDASSAAAATAALHAVRSAAPDDVVVVLLSGGASSLLALPSDGISVEDYRDTTRVLQNAGASIDELNCVRKQIDVVKAGGLARAAAPRRVVALIISDVVDNRLDVIGSGPLTPDSTGPLDALAVLRRYNVVAQVPSGVLRHIENASRSNDRDRSAVSYEHVRTQIIADNRHALDAAVAYSRKLGYNAVLIAEPTTGPARDAGRYIGARLRAAQPDAAPSCMLAGGETTVVVTGNGIGGRNQELALAAAIEIDRLSNCVLLSAGTDGIDGPTHAAGAIVDGGTCDRIRSVGLVPAELLGRNDSYTALAASDDLLITGPTGTNVMDIQILLRR
jgi:hydroxypyruvate reductase